MITEDEFKSKVLFMGFKPTGKYDDTTYKNLWKIPNSTIYFQYIFDQSDILVISIKTDEFKTFRSWDKAIGFLSKL